MKKRRIFDIIQIGNDGDTPSRLFDIASIIVILVNLFIAIVDTFDSSAPYQGILNALELITVLAFTVEYILRVWTAEYLYPAVSRGRATAKYMLSFGGVIDLLSFLPYYLPFFFPAGVVAFRIFRVIRILRLFRINAYYDALNVIGDVLKNKKDQLLSSVFIIFILMTASSLCMYSLEHEAQPEVFKDAFSGLWWAVSTLLTVGYGDIYPITLAGRFFGMLITILGVGMVAIPTGILSAGFVEQYTRLKTMADYSQESEIHFIKLMVGIGHPWEHQTVRELKLPPGLNMILIDRNRKILVPRGDTEILSGDQLVLGGEGYQDDYKINLKELLLKEQHPWVGQKVKDLDISRQSMIVMIRRDGKVVIPTAQSELKAGDQVVFYSKRAVVDAQNVSV
jgi:voltage-gated potassium channel